MNPKKLYEIDMELVKAVEEDGFLLWMEEYTGESGNPIKLSLYMVDAKDVYTIRYVGDKCVFFMKVH